MQPRSVLDQHCGFQKLFWMSIVVTESFKGHTIYLTEVTSLYFSHRLLMINFVMHEWIHTSISNTYRFWFFTTLWKWLSVIETPRIEIIWMFVYQIWKLLKKSKNMFRSYILKLQHFLTKWGLAFWSVLRWYHEWIPHHEMESRHNEQWC